MATTHCLTAAAGIAALALAIAGCGKSPPANVAAMVNNRAITYQELNKTFQSQQASATAENANDEQVLSQKLEILRSLIDNEIMLQRAEKLGLMAVDADVDAKINELKAPYTKEEFQRQLDQKKMTMDDLRTQIRRGLTVEKLFNKEITSHITITDADIANAYNA